MSDELRAMLWGVAFICALGIGAYFVLLVKDHRDRAREARRHLGKGSR